MKQTLKRQAPLMIIAALIFLSIFALKKHYAILTDQLGYSDKEAIQIINGSWNINR